MVIEQYKFMNISVDMYMAYEIYLLLITDDGKHINAYGPRSYNEITVISAGQHVQTPKQINQLHGLRLEAIVDTHQQLPKRQAIHFRNGPAYQWMHILASLEIGQKIQYLNDYLEDLHS